jgi:Flp pilus assembly CpaF family ATPase
MGAVSVVREDASSSRVEFDYAYSKTTFEAEMGPTVVEALQDPANLDIVINPDARVFAERSDGSRAFLGTVDPGHVEMAVRVVAHVCRREVGASRVRLTARLPWSGDRFSAHLRPGEGGPAVSIRKHLRRGITLAEYRDAGALSGRLYDELVRAVEARRRVLVVGGTGSGKTTFVNALLAQVAKTCPEDRVYAIEEVRELRVENADATQIECEAEAFRAEVEFAMRMNPGRLCVGEVRGAEAIEVVKAWTSGHAGGFATVHANDAAAAVRRLGLLAELGLGRAIPLELLADAIDFVVLVQRGASGRREVGEIVEVSFDPSQGGLRFRTV